MNAIRYDDAHDIDRLLSLHFAACEPCRGAYSRGDTHLFCDFARTLWARHRELWGIVCDGSRETHWELIDRRTNLPLGTHAACVSITDALDRRQALIQLAATVSDACALTVATNCDLRRIP